MVRDVYNKYFNNVEGGKMNNDLISLFDIPKIKVSVDTFWFFKHCMKDNYFNAHIMIRMLAIDCYYGKMTMVGIGIIKCN